MLICIELFLNLQNASDSKESLNADILNITVDKGIIINKDQDLSFLDKYFCDTKILTIPSSGQIININDAEPSTSYATEIIAAPISQSKVGGNAPNTVDVSLLEAKTFEEKYITNVCF